MIVSLGLITFNAAIDKFFFVFLPHPHLPQFQISEEFLLFGVLEYCARKRLFLFTGEVLN